MWSRNNYLLNWRKMKKFCFKFLQENGKEQLDLIALKCSIPTFKAATLLLNMELKGVIKPLPGKLFEAI